MGLKRLSQPPENKDIKQCKTKIKILNLETEGPVECVLDKINNFLFTNLTDREYGEEIDTSN